MEAPAEAPISTDFGAHPKNCTDGFESFFQAIGPNDIAADVRAVWDDAVAAQAWEGPPVWVHGDLHPPNELLLCSGEADLESLDFTQPAFAFGFGNAGDEVVADVDEPCPLGRIRSEERSSDTSFSELAIATRGSV